MTCITVEIDRTGIALATIDVAGRSSNVATTEFMNDLESFVNRLERDETIKAAVITSGKADFMSGADLFQVIKLYESTIPVADRFATVYGYSRLLRRLETCGKPIVAAINGTALGFGLELALACHYRLAATDANAKLGLPEVLVGLLPGAGGTQRLPRLVGIRRALELITQGTQLTAEKALALGLIDGLSSSADLIAAAKEWLVDTPSSEQPWDREGYRIPGGDAWRPSNVQLFIGATAMVAEKTQHNFPAVPAILSCLFEGTSVPMDTSLRIESRYFVQLTLDPVYRNLIRTMFINKGAADKLVRRPKDVERTRVKKLGMLGAGAMGAGIAFVSARAGIDVVLLDRSLEDAERGKSRSRSILQRLVNKGRLANDEAEAIIGRIQATTEYQDLDGCELIVEAVYEDVSTKADVTRRAERIVSEATVFATNTSALPITHLADASERPENFIGLHFFSPVEKMPLVEVICGEKTSAETLAKSLDYIQQIRKTPIVVMDGPGFFTSRVIGTYIDEGMALLKDGVKPALIENAARQVGMPVGPLGIHDEVAIDLSVKIHRQTEALNPDITGPESAFEVAEKLVELGRLGRKSKAGFYDYPDNHPKHLWSGLNELWPAKGHQPSVAEVQKRLLFRQALDAARCYESQIIRDPESGDIGAILGIGFPAYTGGPLSYIDTMGVAEFVNECDRLAASYGARFEPTDTLRAMATAGRTFYPANDVATAWVR